MSLGFMSNIYTLLGLHLNSRPPLQSTGWQDDACTYHMQTIKLPAYLSKWHMSSYTMTSLDPSRPTSYSKSSHHLIWLSIVILMDSASGISAGGSKYPSSTIAQSAPAVRCEYLPPFLSPHAEYANVFFSRCPSPSYVWLQKQVIGKQHKHAWCKWGVPFHDDDNV